MGHLFAKADAVRIPLADQSVDLVVGSPPYLEARLYLEGGKDLGIARDCDAWIEWMLRVTAEALRVSRGAVIWIASGCTRDRNYLPACEGLMYQWWRRNVGSGVWQDGIELPGEGGSMYRPCYWHRVGIPGSGGDQWFRADVEYALCFKRPGPLPWTDNTACGAPPKWDPGGEMSNRVKDGHRRNQWDRHENCATSQRKADGTFQAAARPSHRFGCEGGFPITTGGERSRDGEVQWYVPPVIANPGNLLATDEETGELLDLGPSVIHTTTGGGKLGWQGAHDNEAPFPEVLVERFVKSLSPPKGRVLDPFSGSGTVVRVASRLGRRGIGFDLRESQCKLGIRGVERPHAPIRRQSARPKAMPLLDHLE